MKPIRRRLYLTAFIFVFFLTGLFLQNGSLIAIAVLFLVYVFDGALVNPAQVDLVVTREISHERVNIGVPVKISVTVLNKGRTLDEVILEDVLPTKLKVIEGNSRHLLRLRRGETINWEYQIVGMRGHFFFSNLKITTIHPTGLNIDTSYKGTPGQLFVIPSVARLKHITIQPLRTRNSAGAIPSRAAGSGVEFFDVREYQMGDPRRRINWRASARHPSSLYSNDYVQERAADIGIIIDGRVRTNSINDELSIYEYSVQAAASLATALNNRGDRVSMLFYGEYLKWVMPGYGRVHLERMMRALSQGKPGESQVFSYLQYIPARLFPPQSQVVLISPLAIDDTLAITNIRARGYELFIISPDPVELEERSLPKLPENNNAARIVQLERGLQLRAIRQMGIRVLNWNVSNPFEVALEAFLVETPDRLRRGWNR